MLYLLNNKINKKIHIVCHKNRKQKKEKNIIYDIFYLITHLYKVRFL